jgi:hypothetical protein
MIYVKAQVRDLGPGIRALFTFDDGLCIGKGIRVIGGDRPAQEREVAYQITMRYREAVRDWLFHHRGAFGRPERTMERLLFKLNSVEVLTT